MGRGIAYIGGSSGFNVTLVDLNPDALVNAKEEINIIFEKGLRYEKITDRQVAEAQSRIFYSSNLGDAASEADLIIEAVTEDSEIKKSVFETIEKYAQNHCYFATNTSTMSPTEIASFAKRPEKTIAMHFFNPVQKMPLVEIVRGLETSDETTTVVKEVAKKMGKEIAVINEFPGFVTSRISSLVGNEAFYMLQEGLGTPEEIDKAIKTWTKLSNGTI